MPSWVGLKAKARFAKGEIDWLTDTIRAIPVSAEPNRDTVDLVSDVVASEIGSSRVDLASRAVNEDAVGDEVELDAADFTHPNVATGSTAVGSVLYKRVGADDSTPADDPVLAFLDYTDTPTNGGSLLIQLSPEGAIKF